MKTKAYLVCGLVTEIVEQKGMAFLGWMPVYSSALEAFVQAQGLPVKEIHVSDQPRHKVDLSDG